MKRRYFKSSTWGQIKQGDIIKVKHDQEIPCDGLILNIIDSRVDSQSCFEANTLWYETPQLKRSYAGTAHHTNYSHKDEAFKFIELVSGFVKWEYNSSGFVGGTFKQVDNPAAVDITDANIVHCGSVITQC